MNKNRIITALLAFILISTLVFPTVSSAETTGVDTPTIENTDNTEDTYTDEQPEYDPEYAAVIEYADQIELLGKLESKSIDTYNKYRYITSSNRKEAYLSFNNVIVPNYTNYVIGLKKIKPTNTELKKIHDTYVKGASLHLQAFTLFKQSLYSKSLNHKLFNQANDKLSAGRKLLTKYSTDFKTYVAKFE